MTTGREGSGGAAGLRVTGVVTSRGPWTVNGPKVDVTVSAPDGALLGAGTGYASANGPLSPGQSAQFSLLLRDEEAVAPIPGDATVTALFTATRCC